MATTGRSLQDLASVMTRLPQVLVNVPGVDKARADEDAVLAAALATRLQVARGQEKAPHMVGLFRSDCCGAYFFASPLTWTSTRRFGCRQAIRVFMSF